MGNDTFDISDGSGAGDVGDTGTGDIGGSGPGTDLSTESLQVQNLISQYIQTIHQGSFM